MGFHASSLAETYNLLRSDVFLLSMNQWKKEILSNWKSMSRRLLGVVAVVITLIGAGMWIYSAQKKPKVAASGFVTRSSVNEYDQLIQEELAKDPNAFERSFERPAVERVSSEVKVWRSVTLLTIPAAFILWFALHGVFYGLRFLMHWIVYGTRRAV